MGAVIRAVYDFTGLGQASAAAPVTVEQVTPFAAFFQGGGASGVSDGNYGDISVAGAAWTINAGAVDPVTLAPATAALFAPIAHGHAVLDVAGLQAALDGKAATGHGHADATPSAAGFMTGADKSKLDGVATGATANATDAALRDRATHTGAQAIATVTGLQAALDGKASAVHGHVAADVTDFAAAARATLLTGYSAAGSRIALAAGDTILGAFNKLGKWVADLAAIAFSGSAADLTAGTLPAARFDDTAHGSRAGGGLHANAVAAGAAGFMTGADKTKLDGTTGKLIQSSTVELTDSGALRLPAATPAVPGAAQVAIFGQQLAGRVMPAALSPGSLEYQLQAFLGANRAQLWQANGNATTATNWGDAISAAGTATTRNVATTNLFTRMRRLGYPTAGTAGSLAGIRQPSLQHTLGAGGTPALGGFFAVCRFGLQAVSASARVFIGMHNSAAAPTNANPAGRTQQVGVARIDGSPNLHVVFGGTSAQTPIDLGANFPADTANADFYQVTLFAPPGVTETVHYHVWRMNTGHVASGTLTGGAAVLPSATTLLAFNSWISNNADAVAVGIDWASFYFERDF